MSQGPARGPSSENERQPKSNVPHQQSKRDVRQNGGRQRQFLFDLVELHEPSPPSPASAAGPVCRYPLISKKYTTYLSNCNPIIFPARAGGDVKYGDIIVPKGKFD